jgi:hypothetical protein
MAKSLFKVAIVKRGKERSWREYWTRGEAKGDGDSAPEGLGRTDVVEAASAEEAIATVQRMHPDCTVMLAGDDDNPEASSRNRKVEGPRLTMGREERLRRSAKERVVPKIDQPGPAKNVGDNTPNPLPEEPRERGGKGGDAGRSS